MENNVDQKNSKVLSEVDLAEDSSKDGYKQNDQPKTTLPKTENWIKETYKKLSKSCEKLPPLIRKNSNDGLFLNRSISSKTFTEHFNSTEHKNSKKYQTLDIMKIKDGGNVDETKDSGTPTRPSITEIINNAGLPSLFSHTLPADFFKPKYFHKGFSEISLESSVQKLEDLNKKQSQFCRQDSASTTSSFLSIGEDFTWKKGDLLGSGSYGKVWRGLTSDGKQIAVKQIVLDLTDREKAEREYQKVQEEVEILKTLQHKNIVSFLGMRREGEEVSIFMQYVTGGSIAQLLARFGPLDEPVFCSYTQQILEGVKYLHDKNVIHRDIKGGNVMLMPNSTIKLVDFGCAKRLCYNLSKNSFYNPTSLQGTPYWMAPEVVQETGHGKKSDIWSIGCTVFEMATKSPPWSDMNPYAAIFAICSSKPVPKLPSEFSQKAQDFVRVCLIRDPTERPTANELLQDKFITTPHHGRRRKSMTCFN